MYIIQTNTLVDDKGIERDFQSMMYQIKEQTWGEFKEYILSNEDFTMKLVNGTMAGTTKPRQSRVTSILINDERHLRVMFDNNIESKYYMVLNEQFDKFLNVNNITNNTHVYCINCDHFRFDSDENCAYCHYENECDITDCEDSRPFSERPHYRELQ